MATAKPISEKVAEGFTGDTAREYALNYTETLQQNVRDLQSNFNRSLLLLFFLIAAFVLLSQAAVEEVSVGAFKLKDYSLLYTVLPAAIAYVYHEMTAVAAARNLNEIVHARVVREVHRPLYDHDLAALLTLPTPNYVPDLVLRFARSTMPASRTQGVINKLLSMSNLPLGVVVILGPGGFAAYAFYKLFSVFGVTRISVWLSLIVTIYYLIMGFVVLLAQWRVTNR